MVLLLLIGLAHWLTPTSGHSFHMWHVIFRKLFFVPILLAAVWYDLKGAMWCALMTSLIFIPHVVLQWSGQVGENINQVGEVITLWMVALTSGFFIKREKQALKFLVATREGALLALVKALDMREHHTHLHSVRVSRIAVHIGRRMKLSRIKLDTLRQASLLHDIGKIGIPDSIILKESPLTKEEWEVMKRHPKIGRDILASVLFLSNLSEIIYCHHEKFDGTGYPSGCIGTEIPFLARIFAVADVFDALTSDRPYHRRVSYAEAIQHIASEANTHFDPLVVNAFLEIDGKEWEKLDQRLTQE